MAMQVALASIPMFKYVTPAQMAKLGAATRVIRKARGEALLLAGETVPGVGIVVTGRVGVYPASSGIKALVTLGAGEAFGEMTFLDREVGHDRASATIRAEEDGTQVLIVPHPDIAALVATDPEFGRGLYRGMAMELSRKLRHTTVRIVDELRTGQRLLAEIAGAEGEEDASLAGLAADLAERTRIISTHFERADQLAGELHERCGDRTLPTAALRKEIDTARGLCLALLPRVARRIGAIATFVASIDQFVRGQQEG